MEITEREFAVINEISNSGNPGQRAIASKLGISLGLTNLIVKNLINKGYVKAKQLTPRKVQYILTPQGFSEKAKKSYNYTVKTISLINNTRRKLKDFILNEISKGAKYVIVSENNEMVDMLELALLNINGGVLLQKDNTQDNPNMIKFLDEKRTELKAVDVIEFLSESVQY